MTTEATATKDGTVAVTGGRLVVSDPGPGGERATVLAGEGVVLVVDGKEMTGSVGVDSGTDITAEAPPQDPETTVEVAVSADGMKAELVVRRVDGVEYALRDAAPARDLVVSRRPERALPAPPPRADDARAALAVAGVTHGVSLAAVRDAVSGDRGRVAVAAGTPPEPPVDAVVTIPGQSAMAANPLFSVRAGTVLAKKTPARRGTPGTTVLGTPVEVRDPLDPPLEAGKGARMDVHDDGVAEVRAEVDGHPVVRGALVSVEERITITGEVGVGTGDVAVFGVLEVVGDVEEGRVLSASRDLLVSGEVHRADVQAGRALTITGGCVHSHLRAGGPTAVFSRALSALADGDREFREYASVTAQLLDIGSANAQQITPGRAAYTVLHDRYPDLPAKIRLARAVLLGDPDKVPEALLRAYEAAFNVTDALGAHDVRSAAVLRMIAGALERETLGMRAQVGDPAPLTAPYVQDCTVEASGDLHLTGVGMFTSTVYVGGDLVCDAEGATIRGGFARVRGLVRAHELGAPGEAKAVIELEGRTTRPDRLTARVVHPGVHIVVNGVEVEFPATRVNLSLGADDEGHVTHASQAG